MAPNLQLLGFRVLLAGGGALRLPSTFQEGVDAMNTDNTEKEAKEVRKQQLKELHGHMDTALEGRQYRIADAVEKMDTTQLLAITREVRIV